MAEAKRNWWAVGVVLTTFLVVLSSLIVLCQPAEFVMIRISQMTDPGGEDSIQQVEDGELASQNEKT